MRFLANFVNDNVLYGLMEAVALIPETQFKNFHYRVEKKHILLLLLS